jgi:transcriptional regulator with PAS, ATPase and Fis domain
MRVIAATNRNMFEMMEEGRFRRDLYYRLNVLALHLPPLRERMEDIIPLVEYFISRQCPGLTKQKIADIGRILSGINYSWPGNVREIRNIMERFSSFFRKEGDATVVIRDVIADYLRTIGIFRHEKDTISQVIARSGGSKTKAAKELGISRTTLWRKTRRQIGPENPNPPDR